jgi:hypothetical protein
MSRVGICIYSQLVTMWFSHLACFGSPNHGSWFWLAAFSLDCSNWSWDFVNDLTNRGMNAIRRSGNARSKPPRR